MDQILNLLSQTHWDHFVWYGVTVILLSAGEPEWAGPGVDLSLYSSPPQHSSS